jgi:hypothetical protein
MIHSERPREVIESRTKVMDHFAEDQSEVPRRPSSLEVHVVAGAYLACRDWMGLLALNASQCFNT